MSDTRPRQGGANLADGEAAAVGRKVVLSYLRNSDIPFIQQLVTSPEVRTTWRTRGEYWSPAEVQGRVAADSALALVARRQDTAQIIGIAELLDLSLMDRRAHLGLAVHPSAQAMGLGVEIGLLFLATAFRNFAIEKICFSVFAENGRIQPGLMRLFRHEGTLVRQMMVNGCWVDVDMFAMWREDLPALLERFGLSDAEIDVDR